MKKNTSIIKEKQLPSIGMLFFIILLSFINVTQAQIQQNGTLFIGDDTYFYIDKAAASFDLGTNSTTITTRTGDTSGKIIFGSGFALNDEASNKAPGTNYPITLAGGSIFASTIANPNFFDGYVGTVGTLGTGYFTVPTGAFDVAHTNYFYSPVRLNILSNSATTGVSVAYFKDIATGAPGGAVTNLDPIGNVLAISKEEYWDVRAAPSTNAGAFATFSLTWGAQSKISDLLTLAGSGKNVYDLTIVGYDTAKDKWVDLGGFIDSPYTSFLGLPPASETSGTITLSSSINVNLYAYFTLGVVADCADFTVLYPPSSATFTWNGSIWSKSGTSVANAVPSLNDYVIINSIIPNSPGSFDCNTLVLNSDLKIKNGETVTVVNGVSAASTAKVVMESQASFVQKEKSVDVPMIQLSKVTRALNGTDYTYFGSPVKEDILSQLDGAYATSLGNVGYKHALNNYYERDATNTDWIPLSSIKPVKGFIAMVKDQAPFLVSGVRKAETVTLPITGKANNGNLTTDAYGVDSSASIQNFNLIANPYPSAIDPVVFLSANNNLDGVIYIWEAKTSTSGNAGDYTQSDFVTRTLSGSVTNSDPDLGNGSLNVNGDLSNYSIPSMQGFVVRSLGVNQQTSVVRFDNCMRVVGKNDQFAKTPQNKVENRFKLNLTSKKGDFSQMLVGYFDNCTLAYDRMFDAIAYSTKRPLLYAVLDSDKETALSINARPSFNDNDAVAIGFVKDTEDNEEFTIKAVEQEGIFTDGLTNVYLHDKVLKKYHNLAQGGYTFSTNKQEVSDRFEIVYKIDDITDNSNTSENSGNRKNDVIVTIQTGLLKIKSTLEIANVDIFEISGKKLESIKGNKRTIISNPFNNADGVYIVKIKLEDGTLFTQKVINKK